MNSINEMNNNNITLNVFSALSFYSPLILMMSILLFSINSISFSFMNKLVQDSQCSVFL